MPEGAAAYQKLVQGGFSAQEADGWKAQQNAKLQSGGFTGQEIANYWGEGDPNFASLDQHVGGNVHAAVGEEPTVASNPLEMLAAGWDMSVSGLALKGLPKTVAPQDAGLLGKIAFGAAQLVGDSPAVVAGLVGGASVGVAAGAAVPGAGETGVSEAVGGLAGGGFGSAALPEAMRGVLMDHYEHPDGVLNFKDFMARSSAIAYNSAKQGVIGMVSAPVGGAVGGKVLAQTGRVGAAALADMGSYTVTATALGGLMDGKAPDAQDFAAGAALMLGFHVGAKVSGPQFQRIQQNMRDIYRKSGVTPGEQVQMATKDKSYAQTIMGRTPDMEALSVPNPKGEPAPFKANALKTAQEHQDQITDILSSAHAAADKRPLSRDESLDLVRRLENSGDKAVSPKGAVGRYQITPDTARTYGLDVNRLTDPKYSEAAAEKIIGALSSHYKNTDGSTDMEAVLIAYNAGPGRANAFIRGGRDRTKLPLETQRYLEHADRLGGLNDKFGVEPDAAGGGKGGGNEPPKGGGKGGGDEPPTPEELVAKAQGVIANPVEASLSQKLADQKKRFVFDAVSELAPAERIDRAIGTPEDEFGIADAFRQTYGSAGRAWHRVTVGGLERQGEAYVKNDAPPLMSIYDSAKTKGSIQELTAVRLAARTMELQGRGMKTPMKVEDAQAIMDTLGAKYKDELAQARAANNSKIDDYVDAGMMSKENAEKMKADNADWFPHITEQSGTVAARKGGRFGPVQVVKRVKGHESQILDPRTQEIKSFYAMAAAADKNRATTALMQALKKEDLSNWGIELKETGEAAHKEADDMMQAIVDGSIDGPKKLADNQFAHFVDGKRHVYQAEDPQIAQMIRGLSPINPDQTLAAFRWFAKIKRSGITDMPDFIARAMAKDAGGSAILSKWGGVPFVNTVRGLFHLSKADPVFQDFVANGGLGAALSDMDAQWITRDLHRMDQDAGFFAATINTVKHPLEAAQLVMQRMDAATRIGVKLNAESSGLTPLKAATEARKASLDFSEKSGSQVLNLLAGIVPFYRPSILGLKQMHDAFTQRPGTTALKAGVYIAAPTAILYAMNYMQDQTLPEGQRFEDLPRWQKDTMFVLPSINGVRIRLPMPPVLGTLVGGLTNRALDHFVKSDPRAFKDWAGTLLAQFVPPVVPAAIAPIWEHMANYNSFQNAPLIPHSLEDASGYEQFLPSTSEVGKHVASILGPPGLNLVNVSPIVLDNYVRQWTGGLGTAILRATNGVFDPGKPSELADNPFIGSLFARTPALSSKDISDFYDGMDKVKQAHKDFSLAVERGDISDIDLTSKNVQAFINLTQISEALKQQRAAVNAITHDEKMTQNEKRQFIDDIASGMVQTAKGGLKVLEAVDGK